MLSMNLFVDEKLPRNERTTATKQSDSENNDDSSFWMTSTSVWGCPSRIYYDGKKSQTPGIKTLDKTFRDWKVKYCKKKKQG